MSDSNTTPGPASADENLIRGTTDAEEAFSDNDVDAAVAAAEAAAGEGGIDWSETLSSDEDEDDEASGEVGDDGEAVATASSETPDAPEASLDGDGDGDGEAEPEVEEGPAPSGPTATAWAKITERERKLQTQADEMKARVNDLAIKEQAFREAYQANVNRDQQLRQDPIAALTAAGVDIDVMLEGIITGRASPVHQQNNELEQIKQKLAQLESEKQNSQGAAFVNKWRSDAQQIFQGEKYQLLQVHPDPVGELEELCIAWHQQNGTVLPPEQGADMLLEARREELRNTYSHPAVRKELGVPEDGDANNGDPANSGQSAKQAPRTITKNMRVGTKKPQKRSSKSGPFDSDGGIDRALAEIEKRGGIPWDEG